MPKYEIGQEFRGPVVSVKISKMVLGENGIEQITASIWAHESPDKPGERTFSLKSWEHFIGDREPVEKGGSK